MEHSVHLETHRIVVCPSHIQRETPDPWSIPVHSDSTQAFLLLLFLLSNFVYACHFLPRE